jgi:hypothetical protein
MSNTGGWSLTEDYADEGTLCLQRDDGGWDIVYNNNPLNPSQMRALAEHLISKANEMET